MTKESITSYNQAKQYYNRHIENQSGKYEGCALQNNTRVVKRQTPRGEAYAIKLHSTDVVTYYEDGRIELSNGGWSTPTTKKRINRHTPGNISIVQEDYQWYLVTSGRDEEFDRSATIEPKLARA